MTQLDPTSEAIGRISAGIEELLKQNMILFGKIDDIQKNGCIAGRDACTSSRRSGAIFGGGVAAAIAGVVEIIRQTVGSK